ncbi:antibiotic biosynthesis monooxygenase [Pseudarthrobacter sp. NIBRBAC000502772]|uniref:antibiotic biosynthesis monooxygenase family protein n=1 Tax=Pseudarthrobacter sp. NIBRBAC000502772 TaxID=2590775 RepID=UPI0011311537|nr:antibiotic biosynthesis monooxygenase [Pseudarthrobacter sp. NIBRBAC000502772]QDG65427.1 antibiotic biosynthesis monooxygenase [Pseudarthrobacter sp. NIBRBAC000502772]
MIREIATLTITPGSETEFEAAVAQAAPLFQRAPGALSFMVERSIEDPAQYTLTVGWTTLEDHTVGFRGSQEFQQWRELVGPFFAAPPMVRHLQHIYQGF